MAKKLSVGVLFGGRSGEHEVSLVSAASVISALDPEKYDVTQVGITKDGRWFAGPNVMQSLKTGAFPTSSEEVVLLPEPTRRGLFNLSGGAFRALDVVFPVLHGTYGEDGAMQGLFELASIPYVGAGVLGSSVGMDKIVQKDLLSNADIPVAPYLSFLSRDFEKTKDEITNSVESKFGYPVFVKPANSGSSVGINKSHDRKELIADIRDAARYDRKVIVEKGIENAREIELAVLGNDDPRVSCAGEVVPSNEFYDYNAKYVDGKSKTVVPAELLPAMEKNLQEYAIRIFKTLDLAGMARVDFLVSGDKFYVTEANTLPGFTSISMYPKLWEASGLSYPKLLDELIMLAISRSQEKSEFLTSYKPKEDWFK